MKKPPLTLAAKRSIASKSTHRTWTVVSCSVMALAASAEADAQSGAEQGRIIQEITVTATRREESLSRVPISVTALDNEALDNLGVVSVDDLTRLTPGLNFTRSGYADTTDISIRGIASSVGTSTTGVYIDETPVQVRSLGFAATNLYPANFDLERVEVLRGPQGTLFGAGSEGGTVRFITTQPSRTDYSGYARADYGFTDGGGDSWELGGAFGGPIVADKLGFRASAWGRHTGGFIDRVSPIDSRLLQEETNERDEFAGRLAFSFTPSDAVTLTLSGFYQETEKKGTEAYFDRLSSAEDEVFRAADPLGSPTKEDWFVGSFVLEAELGDSFTLTSVSSYLDRTHRPVQDYSHFMPTLVLGPSLWDHSLVLPFFPEYALASPFENTQENFTQEIRIQTADSNSRWSGTLGVFYMDAEQGSTQTIIDPMLPEFVARLTGGLSVEDVFGAPMLSPTVSYISRDTGTDKQLAVFGEVSYELTDRLKATAGVRYAKVEFDFTNLQAGPWAGTEGTGASGSQEEEPVTPKVGLTYQHDDQNMYYVTAAKGFRVGGANRPIPITSDACRGDLAAQGLQNAPLSYDSDEVWSYEVGAKNTLLEGRLQLSSSLFYIDWTDIQQSVFLTNCGFDYVGNLGSAISKGGDIQVLASPTANLSFALLVAYTDAYYSEDVLGGIGPGGVRSVLVSDGNALPHAPWSATLSAEYRFTLFGNRESFVRLTHSYESKLDTPTPGQDAANQGYDPDSTTPPETNFTSIRAGTQLGGLEISVYGENIFNKHPELTRFNDISGSQLFYVTTPVRTYGIRGAYRF